MPLVHGFYILNFVISTFIMSHTFQYPKTLGNGSFVVQVSLLIVTFLSFTSRNLSIMQTTKEVSPHPHIASCVNMRSVVFFFFFLCRLLDVGACVRHIAHEAHGVDHNSVGDWRTNSNCPHISFVLFHNVTCYTNSIASRIHVNTIKLCNTTCTLVATRVILWSLECTSKGRF